MTTIGTSAVDNMAITDVDQAAANEAVAQQTSKNVVDSVSVDKTVALKAAVEEVANEATVGDASAQTSGRRVHGPGMNFINSFFKDMIRRQ